MNLWNLTTLYVLPLSDGRPSAFDPSRTGDPVTSRDAVLSPGLGRVDAPSNPSETGAAKRRPIGFAPSDAPPPVEERAPSRTYRTEISFRRHAELPSASARQGSNRSEPSGEQSPWQTPSTPPDAVAVTSPDPAAESDDASTEAVPFYKRDFTFRRRKDGQGALVEANDASGPPDAGATADGTPEEVAGEADDASAAERVPFYRREVSLRRKTHGAVAEVDADASAEGTTPADEPDVVEESVAADAEVTASLEAEAEVQEPGDDVQADPSIEAPAAAASESQNDAPADDAPVHDGPSAVGEEPTSDAAASNGSSSSRWTRPSKARNGRRGSRPQGGKGHPVVGLKIGASQIAAAVIAKTDAGNELLQLARRPLDSGIVVDGEVRDEEALARALKDFFEAHKLPRRDIRIGLSSNRIGVRTVDMPGVEDDEQFANAVRFKAHEVLPVALHDSVLDYRVLGQRVDSTGGDVRRVLLVVAPRDQVEPYQRVAALAGLRLAGADLEALALLRAFVDPSDPAAAGTETATVAVSIGHESSTLLVSGAGECEFTRVFDWGGGVLEEAIASALDVRHAEAATILRHLSLAGPGRKYEALDEAGRARATDAVRQRLTPFARELVNSLQFYQTQADSLGIGRIVITGGTSHLEGLDAALHQMIGVDVTVGDPFARVQWVGELDPTVEATIGSLAVPVGLAIEDDSSRSINLLPKDMVGARRARRETALRVAVPLAVAVPLVTLGFLFVGAHGKVSSRQSELDAVEAQIAALPQPKPVVAAGVTGDEAARATAVANVLGGRLAWEAVFADLSRVLPENVWLTSLSLEQAGAAAGAAAPPAAPGLAAQPTAVQIDGFTYTQPDVARLLARLATVPSLQRVTLTSSESQTVGERKVVHFAIVADLTQSGGAS